MSLQCSQILTVFQTLNTAIQFLIAAQPAFNPNKQKHQLAKIQHVLQLSPTNVSPLISPLVAQSQKILCVDKIMKESMVKQVGSLSQTTSPDIWSVILDSQKLPQSSGSRIFWTYTHQIVLTSTCTWTKVVNCTTIQKYKNSLHKKDKRYDQLVLTLHTKMDQ